MLESDKSNESDFDDCSSYSASQILASESSPRIVGNLENSHSSEMHTELFSIEMAIERPLCDYGAYAKLSGYGPLMISKGSSLFRAALPQQAVLSTNDMADASRKMELLSSTSGQVTGKCCHPSCKCCCSVCSMGHAVHYERSIPSSVSSRASSFRSMSMQGDNVESLTGKCHVQEPLNILSATKDGALGIDVTKPQLPMHELDDAPSTAKDWLSEIGPAEIRENVKEVISIRASKAHDLQLVDSLLLAEDDYHVFGQQKRYAKEYDPEETFGQQVDSNVSKSGNFKERTIAETDIIQYVVSSNNHSRMLQPAEEHFDLIEEGCKISATAGPFCSVCKQSFVNLGKRPIKFGHDQLSLATNGFSSKNLLAGDDASLVYRGMLMDGHYVTVKKFKEPCVSEVDDRLFECKLLLCAQHRNLVMLLGYCIEDTHFMLVYEYACNKSLSWHLGKQQNPDGLQWWARWKIAVGVARALRYLHEECRGGCIVHHDIRADSIFLTHEFAPMVGNFGLACLHQDNLDGDTGREHASWKSDVYAFGVVLLELITGKGAVDHSNAETEQQSLVDWAQPILLDGKYYEVIDSRLESSHDSFELICMVRAALLCITNDCSSRPRMGQIWFTGQRQFCLCLLVSSVTGSDLYSGSGFDLYSGSGSDYRFQVLDCDWLAVQVVVSRIVWLAFRLLRKSLAVQNQEPIAAIASISDSATINTLQALQEELQQEKLQRQLLVSRMMTQMTANELKMKELEQQLAQAKTELQSQKELNDTLLKEKEKMDS
ncbi:hypothetical protein L7F22_053371 [Adiantum nelumboides]|nr:hypothetical protein [Adiantum nelumboides]